MMESLQQKENVSDGMINAFTKNKNKVIEFYSRHDAVDVQKNTHIDSKQTRSWFRDKELLSCAYSFPPEEEKSLGCRSKIRNFKIKHQRKPNFQSFRLETEQSTTSIYSYFNPGTFNNCITLTVFSLILISSFFRACLAIQIEGESDIRKVGPTLRLNGFVQSYGNLENKESRCAALLLSYSDIDSAKTVKSVCEELLETSCEHQDCVELCQRCSNLYSKDRTLGSNGFPIVRDIENKYKNRFVDIQNVYNRSLLSIYQNQTIKKEFKSDYLKYPNIKNSDLSINYPKHSKRDVAPKSNSQDYYFERGSFIGWLDGSEPRNPTHDSFEVILGKNEKMNWMKRKQRSEEKYRDYRSKISASLYYKNSNLKSELAHLPHHRPTPQAFRGFDASYERVTQSSGRIRGTQTFENKQPRSLTESSNISIPSDSFTRSSLKNTAADSPEVQTEPKMEYQPNNLYHNRRGRNKRKIEVVSVSVVSGNTAILPCRLDTREPDDSVQIVLWIKEGVHTPIYSKDYRELLNGRPKETKPDSNSTLARRTSFKTDSKPAALVVEKVRNADTGVYRCRVDFLLTPTRNTRVNLTVIVPPNRARVTWRMTDSTGKISPPAPPSPDGVIGPFKVGDRPLLTCENNDAYPAPSVRWYEGDQLLDDTYNRVTREQRNYSSFEYSTVKNELQLSSLTRSDLSRRLTCTAANNNRTQPATRTVMLSLILGIVAVRVETVSGPNLVAGKVSEVACSVWGARPPPSIVWWRGSKKFPGTSTKILEGGNLTVSILQFTPQPEHDESMLVCQSENPALETQQPLQDSKLLSVRYLPVVSVDLGRSLDPARIKEGDDVYFECSVKAKPSIYNVVWKHDNKELPIGNGIFASNMSLVVQGVSRTSGGAYTCHATNLLGTGISPPLNLDVKYAPVCAIEQRKQHSVGKEENAEISCQVHANPANVSFRWTFNNTAEAIDVPRGRFGVSGTESRVNYTPMTDLDYGTLLCWANNSIGVQENPCVFQIIAAGKPDPPHNCRVFDVTISSLQVTCLPGGDGGMEQNFLLQVFQIGSTSPVLEVSRSSPLFSVKNLRPATAYKILVAAINDKGASRPVELKAYTVRLPETQEETSAEPTRDRDRMSPIPIAVLIGIGVAIVPLVGIVIIVVWVRACRKSGGRDISSQRGNTSTTPTTCEIRPNSSNSTTGLQGNCISESIDTNSDDKNPDLICDTPDPVDASTTIFSDISTITTSSSGFFLGNGGANLPQIVSHNAVNCVDYMQLDRSTRCTSSPINKHIIYSKPPEHSPCQAPSSQPKLVNQISAQQMLDMPLPPPASYNQGYTPDDACSNDHHYLGQADSQKRKAQDRRAVLEHLPSDRRSGGTYSPQGHYPQQYRYHCDGTFVNKDSDQYSEMVEKNNKMNKTVDGGRCSQQRMPTVLSTTTLPRSFHQMSPCLPESNHCLTNLASPQLFRKGSHSISLQQPCQYLSGSGAEEGGPLTPLHYGTLGRMKPASRADSNGAMKGKRETRASASDLTEHRNRRMKSNKQESAV